jgi:uncharacterized RDD family membrane protein YckC
MGSQLSRLVGPLPAAVLQLGLAFRYYAYLEGGPTGQTVGKRLMRIRVVDDNTGRPIGRGRAGVRHLGRIVSALPLFLGYLWMLWDPQKQAWHDKLAGSVVVPATALADGRTAG